MAYSQPALPDMPGDLSAAGPRPGKPRIPSSVLVIVGILCVGVILGISYLMFTKQHAPAQPAPVPGQVHETEGD